jgi:hypothetical protein
LAGGSAGESACPTRTQAPGHQRQKQQWVSAAMTQRSQFRK